MSLLPRRFIAIFIVVTMCCAAMSQPPGNRRNAKPPVPPKKPSLPDDPQLLGLHKEFVVKAEKLALEYERKKQFDKAREVYESMVRLVPNFASAEAGLQRILGNQRIQDRKLVTVEANQMWQDSGVNLQADMPVHTEVKGSWKVVYETGPKGIEIPKVPTASSKLSLLGRLSMASTKDGGSSREKSNTEHCRRRPLEDDAPIFGCRRDFLARFAWLKRNLVTRENLHTKEFFCFFSPNKNKKMEEENL